MRDIWRLVGLCSASLFFIVLLLFLVCLCVLMSSSITGLCPGLYTVFGSRLCFTHACMKDHICTACCPSVLFPTLRSCVYLLYTCFYYEICGKVDMQVYFLANQEQEFYVLSVFCLLLVHFVVCQSYKLKVVSSDLTGVIAIVYFQA